MCIRDRRYAVITVLLVAGTLYALLCFGASPIVSVFNSERNELLQQLAVDGMRLYFSGIVFAGLNILLSTVFAATERGVPAHILSLLRGLLLIIPFALLLAALWGITGIWLAFPAAELLTTVAALLLYAASRKHRMEA